MSLTTASSVQYVDEYESAATSFAAPLRYDHIAGWDDTLKFKSIINRWERDTLFDSLPHAMKSHDSYREILAFGTKAVPLIASELSRKPSFLFLALGDLTNHDPVPEEAYGDLLATVGAWLAWLQR